LFSAGIRRRGFTQRVAHDRDANLGESHIFTQALCPCDAVQRQ
jgi:hypothetical protein